ncbi:unnamed protein product [Somion occarium]|uniref:Uncharacterized protein n=1 Tax=Somion occarium TaxID=3059160 RepID=A0ABP1CTB8_9APHY
MSSIVNPNGTYYGPTDETPDEIFLEKTFMASGYLTGVGYGIQLVLYLACLKALWDQFALPVNVLSLAAYIIGNVLADALLLWRCQVIWAASMGRRANYFMIFPGIMLLGSIAMAIMYAFETASPTAGFFSKRSINFALPYFAISLSLNIILTLMIVAVMLGRKRRGREIFGDTYGRHYTSVSTMFIESAAIYSIISILLLPTYAVQHPINQIWLGLSPSVQMIASYLIIYRVIQGRAWSTDTFAKTNNPASSIAFSSSYGHSATRVAGGAGSTNTIPLHSLPDDSKSGRVQVVTTIQTQTDGEADKDSMEFKKETV